MSALKKICLSAMGITLLICCGPQVRSMESQKSGIQLCPGKVQLLKVLGPTKNYCIGVDGLGNLFEKA